MDDVFDATYGASVNIAVQSGTDSWIKRWISIGQDYLNGGTQYLGGPSDSYDPELNLIAMEIGA